MMELSPLRERERYLWRQTHTILDEQTRKLGNRMAAMQSMEFQLAVEEWHAAYQELEKERRFDCE